MLPPPLKRSLLTLALALSAGPVLAQAASSSASASAPVATQRTTVEQDNLWDIAGQLAPVLGATRQQVMVAVLRRNPEAFVRGNLHRLRRGVTLVLPGREAVLAEDRAASVALVAEHLKAMRSPAVLPPPPPASGVVPPAPPVAKVEPTPAPVPASAPASASVEAPVAPPKPAPVPEPAPAPPPAATPAPVADAASDAPAGGAVSASRVLPWLLGAGALAGGVILWRRRRAGFQPDAAPQEFSNTLSAARPSGPRVFDISNAAAEMARSVESSQVATRLVRHAQDADEVDVIRLTEQAAIKLEMARASLDLGRTEDARALLQAVTREGSGRHAAEAAEILARMG